MPIRTTAPLGAPCWVDLMTSDTERARSFYAEVLGWEPGEADASHGGYFMFFSNGVPVAGAMPAAPGADRGAAWTVYLCSHDIAKTLELAGANGGSVAMAPMQIDDIGTMALLVDPGGAAVGVWQPGTFQGIGVLAETGAPSWFEVQARNYPATLAFYQVAFGWETEVVADTDEFAYRVLVVGGEQLAGIMDAESPGAANAPGHGPASWSFFVGVADADETFEKALSLGAAAVYEPVDTPYGRLAGLSDPTGAGFKLVAPNEAMPARDE